MYVKQDTRATNHTHTAAIPIMERVCNIIIVLTNCGERQGRQMGFDVEQAAIAYFTLKNSREIRFNIDFVSPAGGNAPIDPEILEKSKDNRFVASFMSNSGCTSGIKNTLGAGTILNPQNYDAVLFIGGHGALFDFDDGSINNIAQRIFQSKGRLNSVVGALGHGALALCNAKLSPSNKTLVQDRKVTATTNEEEEMFFQKKDILPYTVEDRLVQGGAHFIKGIPTVEKVAVDTSPEGYLVTGQNTASTERVCTEIIRLLRRTSAA